MRSNCDVEKFIKINLDRVVIDDGGDKWIYGDVYLYDIRLDVLPFRDIHVSGDFYIQNNKLKTLQGSPKTVGGVFICNDNKLKSLEGLPKSIGGDLVCLNNPLETFKGLNDVGGLIYTNKKTDCDYFIQYSLMNKIRFTK